MDEVWKNAIEKGDIEPDDDVAILVYPVQITEEGFAFEYVVIGEEAAFRVKHVNDIVFEGKWCENPDEERE